MNRFLLIIILTFSFQTWTKADDIRDFQIEEMGIGDSLINFVNKDEINDKITEALEEIRPFLKSDGGDISLVSVEEGKHVKVQLHGACVGCSVNQMTLKSGVELTIKKYLPQIETVTSIDANLND